MIAAQYQGDNRTFFFTFHQQGFQALAGVDAQELADFLDAVLVWCVDGFHRHGGRGTFTCRGHCVGPFNIGCVVTIRREGDGILAGVCQYMEFVGAATADGAGVGHHGTEIQANAAEDGAVGLVHIIIGLL